MTDDMLIDALGGTTAVARALGCRPQLVSGWRVRGISFHRKAEILALADRAGIPLDRARFMDVPDYILRAVAAIDGTDRAA